MERRWYSAKDPFTVIMRVAHDEMKVPAVAREMEALLKRHSGPTFELNDFLSDLCDATGILVQFKPMVPEWRATHDE